MDGLFRFQCSDGCFYDGCHDHRLVEQTPCFRHPLQDAGFSTTTRLPPDGHIVWITAEILNVLIDPFQCQQDILHAHIG